MNESENNDYFGPPVFCKKAEEALIVNDKGALQEVYQFTFDDQDFEELLKALRNDKK